MKPPVLDRTRWRGLVPSIPLQRLLVGLGCILFGGSLLSGATVRELAPGLTLVRVHDLADTLPDVKGTHILDLRYIRAADDAKPGSLQQALAQPGALRLVLYDQAPPAALVELLGRRQPKVVTLAPMDAKPEPDVAVAVDLTADRAAYDALEGGTPLSTLVDATVSKPRFDEAALVRARAHLGGGRTAEAAAPPEQPADEAPPEPKDALLQHAVRLARGLEALGRG